MFTLFSEEIGKLQQMSFLEEATSFSLKCINIIEYQQLSNDLKNQCVTYHRSNYFFQSEVFGDKYFIWTLQ
jgi:hypothetical protein